MTNFGNLPFEKLHAYQESRKLLDAVRESAISEGRLRDQALRAATSVCLNISEGAGGPGHRTYGRTLCCGTRTPPAPPGAGSPRFVVRSHPQIPNRRMSPESRACTARAWRSARLAGS